ncbi:hypothetical protein [Streptomyces sp. NPDC052114]|uniref:hypothetical protein n=1 Tax=Streptomyces sp. NPDC052114 TaxID=3155528 RepID=UPI003446A8ED
MRCTGGVPVAPGAVAPDVGFPVVAFGAAGRPGVPVGRCRAGVPAGPGADGVSAPGLVVPVSAGVPWCVVGALRAPVRGAVGSAADCVEESGCVRVRGGCPPDLVARWTGRSAGAPGPAPVAAAGEGVVPLGAAERGTPLRAGGVDAPREGRGASGPDVRLGVLPVSLASPTGFDAGRVPLLGAAEER